MSRNQTNWTLFGGILSVFLVGWLWLNVERRALDRQLRSNQAQSQKTAQQYHAAILKRIDRVTKGAD